MIKEDHLLNDPHWIIPGQNNRSGTKLHPLGAGSDIAEILHIVGTHRVIEEVVLDRPNNIEPHAFGVDEQTQLMLIHVAITVILVGGKDVLDTNFHNDSFLGLVVTALS